MRKLRVFLVDDHALLRDGLRALLERRPSIHVVGEAGDGRQALKLIGEESPDVVVMDIAMPGLNGIEVTRQLHTMLPQTKILALSMSQARLPLTSGEPGSRMQCILGSTADGSAELDDAHFGDSVRKVLDALDAPAASKQAFAELLGSTLPAWTRKPADLTPAVSNANAATT